MAESLGAVKIGQLRNDCVRLHINALSKSRKIVIDATV